MHKQVGYFRRRKILKQANYLDLTPMVQHEHETEPEGTIRLLIPRFSGPILGRLLQPRARHPYMTVSLDRFGTATWLLCDGNRQVRDICRELQGQFGKDIEPAEERVTTFLSQLYKQRMIVFRELTPPDRDRH
jgi:hypothetical protein